MPRAKTKTSPLMILAIALAALVIFAVSLWLTFPFDKIESRAEAELAKKGIVADLKNLRPGLFLGLGAESLVISQYGETPLSLTISPLRISARLGPLLSGKFVFDIEGKTLGGSFSAVFPLGEGEAGASFKELNTTILSDDNPDLLPIMEGKVSGSVATSMPLARMGELTAKADLEISGLSVGPGQVGFISINQIILGSGRISVNSTGGKADLEEFFLTGGDLEMKGSGTAQLAEPIKATAVDMTLNIKPSSPAVVAKLPLLFAFIAPNKNPDGSYTAKLKGAFASPRLTSN